MQTTVITVIATLLCLTACDVDLFGLDRKRLGGGYSLVLTETDNACALVAPHQNGGPVVVEVGWLNPLILTRGDGFKSWDVIDTTTQKETKISDQQRTTDPAYKDIPIDRARDAWKRLKRRQSLW
jgi:hypothetical protein